MVIVTLENVESTGGGYWLERPSLEDFERPGGGYWLVIVTLEDVERPGGGYWRILRDQVAVTGWIDPVWRM